MKSFVSEVSVLPFKLKRPGRDVGPLDIITPLPYVQYPPATFDQMREAYNKVRDVIGVHTQTSNNVAIFLAKGHEDFVDLLSDVKHISVSI